MAEQITKLLNHLNVKVKKEVLSTVDLFANDIPYKFYNIADVTLADLKGYSGIFFYCPVINGHVDVHSILFMGLGEDFSDIITPINIWKKLRESPDVRLYIALQEPEKIEYTRKNVMESLVKDYSPLEVAL